MHVNLLNRLVWPEVNAARGSHTQYTMQFLKQVGCASFSQISLLNTSHIRAFLIPFYIYALHFFKVPSFVPIDSLIHLI